MTGRPSTDNNRIVAQLVEDTAKEQPTHSVTLRDPGRGCGYRSMRVGRHFGGSHWLASTYPH